MNLFYQKSKITPSDEQIGGPFLGLTFSSAGTGTDPRIKAVTESFKNAHLWPMKIDHILINLFVNARDAIAGTGKLILETRAKTFDEEYCNEHPAFIPGDFVLLAISDNSYGMDKGHLGQFLGAVLPLQGHGTMYRPGSVFTCYDIYREMSLDLFQRYV